MTSGGHILAAIYHKEPDRIPIDLGATPGSGIFVVTWHNIEAVFEAKSEFNHSFTKR
jgi:uroporphyrinogen decarboxylase